MSESLNIGGTDLSKVGASTEDYACGTGDIKNPNQADRSENLPASARIVFKASSAFDLRSAAARIRLILEEQSPAGEQYRLLRTKLSFVQKQQPLRTLMITSAVAREGKTFTACCLAAVLAQERGKRVLLVDADLRLAGASDSLGLPGHGKLPGLSQVLSGEATLDDTLLTCAHMDLHFLPAGSPASNPLDLLSLPLLGSELKGLAPLFDWIVIDSPPILPLADSNLLAPLCDGALLVVHANRTPTKLIKDSIERLGKDKFCGVVLNRVPSAKFSRYYSYDDRPTGWKRKR
jgi:capsular exopolysaccharide synthesis family protein